MCLPVGVSSISTSIFSQRIKSSFSNHTVLSLVSSLSSTCGYEDLINLEDKVNMMYRDLYRKIILMIDKSTNKRGGSIYHNTRPNTMNEILKTCFLSQDLINNVSLYSN